MKTPTTRRSSLLTLPILTLLMACGGPAPQLGLSGPSTAAVIWGDTSSFELTLERNETATDEVTLTVEGLPEGVTARFEPATIAGDALTSTLHLDAARDAFNGSALVTVTATGGEELVATHVFALDVGGLTVEGSVESVTRTPLSAPVRVKVGSQWVAADAEGRFVAHQVALPYDLVLSGELVTEFYSGLTTATPRVQGFLDEGGLGSESLYVSGTITPTPASGERVTVCISASSPFASACTTIHGDGARNTYGLSTPVVGAPEDVRKVVARREVLDGAGHSTGFTGYAEAALPFTPGTDQVIDLVLTSSSSSAITFSLEQGAYTLAQRMGRVSYGAYLNGMSNLDADVLHLPEGAQGSITAVVQSEAMVGAVTIQPVNGPLDGPITFATPLAVLSPADGAVLDANAEFVTADPDGQLVTHTFMTSAGIMIVHTFEDRVRLSDLAAQVEGLTPADIGQWIVTTAPHATSPEQALEETVGYVGLLLFATGSYGVEPHPEPLRMGLSTMRSFSSPMEPTVHPSSFFERLDTQLLH